MAMSVTYTNFGGRIITENRGGTVSHYVADTLGSTVALVNTSGTVTDTWTYWPYGEVRSRTGTAPDPKFTWVGSLGYRTTGLSHSEYYVRARHYGQGEARWTTLDPLWPRQGAYKYTGARPAAFPDPNGLCTPYSDSQNPSPVTITAMVYGWAAQQIWFKYYGDYSCSASIKQNCEWKTTEVTRENIEVLNFSDYDLGAVCGVLIFSICGVFGPAGGICSLIAGVYCANQAAGLLEDDSCAFQVGQIHHNNLYDFVLGTVTRTDASGNTLGPGGYVEIDRQYCGKHKPTTKYSRGDARFAPCPGGAPPPRR